MLKNKIVQKSVSFDECMKILMKNYWNKKSKIIEWHKKPKHIIRSKLFYDDGKLNIAYNCIQTNINNGLKNKIAIHLIDKNEKESFLTYGDLDNLIDHFIYFLKKNYSKSELYSNIISIHSSANLCSVISMLGLMKMGITYSVFFNDLSHEAIKLRLKLLNSKIIISSATNIDFRKKILGIKKIKKIKFSEDIFSHRNIKNITFESLISKKKK